MERNNFKKDSRTLADIIKYDGIKAKGFGTIPKFIMHDPDLTIESKTIYGYFCSICGNGETAYPSRNTILRTLKISKNAYYPHYNALIKHGYIKVSKANPSDVKSSNVYTIVTKPPKIGNASSIDAYGYGILPSAVMTDDRLDIKAKGIYCYMASYAGAGDNAHPSKDNILYHLNISEKTYYKYYNQLIQYNYLTPYQRKEKGLFGVCDYILNPMPNEVIGTALIESRRNRMQSPISKKWDIEKTPKIPKQTKKSNSAPISKNRDSTNRNSKNRDSINEDTNINSSNINNFNINSVINQSISETAMPLMNDTIDKKESVIKIYTSDEVANNISLSKLKSNNPNRHEEVDMLYNIICEVLTIDNPASSYLRIARSNILFITVKKEFSKLEMKHLQYVLDNLERNGNKNNIKGSVKNYLMTAIYQSISTIDNYYSSSFAKSKSTAFDTVEAIKQIPSGFNADDFKAKIERNKLKLLS